MKKENDYLQDIQEIRSMMERSSKFLSLSGLSGVMAGIYALIAAYIAKNTFQFAPTNFVEDFEDISAIVYLAIIVLLISIVTAIIFSYRKANNKNEKIWNKVSKRMALNMLIPLAVGGLFMIICIVKQYQGLLIPTSLIFYGLALVNASVYTYSDIRYLGILQLLLGLLSSYYIEFSLLFWSLGFGISHIIYGIYIYYKYEIENNN